MRSATYFAIVLLSACHTQAAREQADELKPGMTTEQVKQLLGQPLDRTFNSNLEAWQYGRVAAFGVCEYRIVWFSDGAVRAVSSRRVTSLGPGCGGSAPPIDWSNAPP